VTPLRYPHFGVFTHPPEESYLTLMERSALILGDAHQVLCVKG
jgi:hypothetical protein